MGPNDRKPPQSYDEIVRRTVPEPDSSFRPTPEQVRDGLAGVRASDDDERALAARITAAVGGVAGVSIEVEHTRVILSGRVAAPALLQQIEDRVSAVEGVGSVDNRLVVAG